LGEDLWIRARIPEIAQKLNFDAALIGDAIRRQRQETRAKKGDSSNPAPNGPSGVGGAKSVPKTSPQKSINISLNREKTKQNPAQNGKKDLAFERRFLSDVITYPDWIPALRNIHSEDPGAIIPHLANQDVAQVMQILLAPLQEGETDQSAIARVLEWAREKEGLKNFVAAKSLQRSEENSTEGLLQDALTRLRKEALLRQQQSLTLKLRDADAQGDLSTCESLQRELNHVVQQIKQLART
jgi:hypothetical protein